VKLRLHGTPAECAAAAARLRRTSGLHVQDESRPYPDRTGELVRVHLTVDLNRPAATASPASAPAPGKGGGGE
jgi:hypothetical protein